MIDRNPVAPAGAEVTPSRPISLADVRHRTLPSPLDSLVRRVAALWTFEPHVPADLRSGLIAELNQLEHSVEVLWLRSESGVPVSADAVRDCEQHYLRLCRRWTGSVAA